MSSRIGSFSHSVQQHSNSLERISIRSPIMESNASLSGTSGVDLSSPTASAASKTSVLGKMKNGLEAFFSDKRTILGLKIAAVVIVVAGLITASVFTFGAAVPAVAALTAVSGFNAVVGTTALLGTGIGLAISAAFTPFMAKACDMFKVTDINLLDTVKFLYLNTLASGVITGCFAVSGYFLGIEGVVAAKAGLGAFATTLLFGGGAGIVRSWLK